MTQYDNFIKQQTVHLLYVLIVFLVICSLVIGLNLFFGLPAVLSWSYFGTILRGFFNTPNKVKWLNYSLGISLFGVALWIALPH